MQLDLHLKTKQKNAKYKSAQGKLISLISTLILSAQVSYVHFQIRD